jgi:hypothetical protein
MLVSPHLVDLILVFTFLEAAVLGLWRRHQSGTTRNAACTPREAGARTAGQRSGPSRVARYGDIGLILLPGIFLLVALRAALAGVAWPWVPLALTAALFAHLLDLRQRWLG